MLIKGRLSLFRSLPSQEHPLQFILASLHYRWNWNIANYIFLSFSCFPVSRPWMSTKLICIAGNCPFSLLYSSLVINSIYALSLHWLAVKKSLQPPIKIISICYLGVCRLQTATSNSKSLCSNFQVFKKLTTFFKSLGVKAVFDTSCSRDLTLIESCNEFIMRYKQSQLTDNERFESSLPMISSACPGIYKCTKMLL